MGVKSSLTGLLWELIKKNLYISCKVNQEVSQSKTIKQTPLNLIKWKIDWDNPNINQKLNWDEQRPI